MCRQAGTWIECGWSPEEPDPSSASAASTAGTAHERTVNMYVIPRLDLVQRRERAVADVLTAFNLFHPHIVTIRDAVTTPTFLCLVAEQVHGGTLAAYVRRQRGLPERAAKFLFQQLCMVLSFCHSRGVYVQHLTPEHVVIDWRPGELPVLKLADCGFVHVSQLPAAWSVPHAQAICAWSAGHLLHVMLYGQPPAQLQAQMQGGVWAPGRFIEAMAASRQHSAWLAAGNAHGTVTCETRRAVHAMLTEPAAEGALTFIKETAWLRAGLPRGVDRANAVCARLSEARGRGELARGVALQVRRAMRGPLSMPPPELGRSACAGGAPQAEVPTTLMGPWLSEVQRAARQAGTHGLTMLRSVRASHACGAGTSGRVGASAASSQTDSVPGSPGAYAVAGGAARQDPVVTAWRRLALATAHLMQRGADERALAASSAETQCGEGRALKRKVHDWDVSDGAEQAARVKAACTVCAEQQECSAC